MIIYYCYIAQLPIFAGSRIIFYFIILNFKNNRTFINITFTT